MPRLFVYPFETYQVRLGWLTSVAPTYNSEWRQQLRAVPRFGMTFSSLLGAESDTDTRNAMAIVEASEGRLLVPDWRYAQIGVGTSTTVFNVSDSSWYPGVGDTVAVFNGPEEIHTTTIATRGTDTLTLTDAFPHTVSTTTWIAPVADIVFSSPPQWTHNGNNTTTLTISGEATEYVDLSSFSTPTMFAGNIILDERTLRRGGTQMRIETNYLPVDNRIGPVSLSQTLQGMQQSNLHSMLAKGPAEMFTLESKLHHIKGRLTPFWKPTWLNDFIPTATAALGATTLLVRDIPDDVPQEVQAITIEYVDGTISHHQVTATAAAAGVLTMTLGTALVQETSVNSVVTISSTELHRLDTDSISFTIGGGVTSAFNVPTLRINAV